MKLHLPFILLAAVLCAVLHADDVTQTLSSDTKWTTIVSNQNATIEAASGTLPDFEISGYSQHAFYSLSYACGSTLWTLQNLGDISVVSNGIVVTDSNLELNNTHIYQGLFRALNISGYGVNTLQMKNNGDLSFSDNSFSFTISTGYAAPIVSFCQYQGGSDEYTVVSIEGNQKNILFDSNAVTGTRDGTVSVYGGCILVGVPGQDGWENNHPKVSIIDSNTLVFSNNTVSATSDSGAAKADGGALYGGGFSIFDLSDNKNVRITGNSVTAHANGKAIASGGGTYGNELRVDNVQNVNISGNKVDSYSENGAAESSGAGCMMETVVITDNGSFAVKDNVTTADGATSSYAYGGGLTTAFTTIIGNEEIEITNNGTVAQQRNETTAATAVGGGINGLCLTMADNKNAIFRGNYLTSGKQTNLFAINLGTYRGLTNYLDVSAPKDGAVSFYDPINVTDDNAEPVVNFNKATEGVEGSGEGTIIFSGKYTEDDLAAIIGRTPTADEIEVSRTSSVACETKLHGGTMKIQEHAVLSAEKFTVIEDSKAVVEVKDGVLKADSITFGKSSSLNMEGEAVIEASALTFATGSSVFMKGEGTTINAADIIFEEGSSLNLNVDMNSGRKVGAAFTVNAEDVSMDGAITLHLNFTQNLRPGSYKIIDTDDDIWAPDSVTTSSPEGDEGEIIWKDGVLYYNLSKNLVVIHDPLADAVQAANWGVYKSSRAFSSLLWAPRPNAVVVKNIETPTADGKGSITSTEVEGRTLAWGSVYSSFSRNSSSGAFAGAEYSIYGGAIGVERQFACGSSIGAAFGYDWGKASPFTTSRVDQESWHAALYGRAAEWKLGQKGSVALDWSAAVGSTTSEHKALGSDWTQENIQLDARATYTYALTERTALSAFVGAQYYAQNDDSTERVEADSLQNLRLMVGGGISHKLTEKTTLFGEAMLFNDTMRHNPDVTLDGFEYGTGANPGRLGGSVTAGAQYQLTPDWTLRGSYSYEGSDNSNEHRVNVGAVYSF